MKNLEKGPSRREIGVDWEDLRKIYSGCPEDEKTLELLRTILRDAKDEMVDYERNMITEKLKNKDRKSLLLETFSIARKFLATQKTEEGRRRISEEAIESIVTPSKIIEGELERMLIELEVSARHDKKFQGVGDAIRDFMRNPITGITRMDRKPRLYSVQQVLKPYVNLDFKEDGFKMSFPEADK